MKTEHTDALDDDLLTPLCDLPERYFERGGPIHRLLAHHGYDESPTVVICQLGRHAWAWTPRDLMNYLEERGTP